MRPGFLGLNTTEGQPCVYPQHYSDLLHQPPRLAVLAPPFQTGATDPTLARNQPAPSDCNIHSEKFGSMHNWEQGLRPAQLEQS